jgi:hypothetical protein
MKLLIWYPHETVLENVIQCDVHAANLRYLAISFTVRFFWLHGDFKMKNNNKSVVPLLLYYV